MDQIFGTPLESCSSTTTSYTRIVEYHDSWWFLDFDSVKCFPFCWPWVSRPHFRHCVFLAKLWSPQLGQAQSPGRMGRPSGAMLEWGFVGGPAASNSSWLGLGAPQRRHLMFKWYNLVISPFLSFTYYNFQWGTSKMGRKWGNHTTIQYPGTFLNSHSHGYRRLPSLPRQGTWYCGQTEGHHMPCNSSLRAWYWSFCLARGDFARGGFFQAWHLHKSNQSQKEKCWDVIKESFICLQVSTCPCKFETCPSDTPWLAFFRCAYVKRYLPATPWVFLLELWWNHVKSHEIHCNSPLPLGFGFIPRLWELVFQQLESQVPGPQGKGPSPAKPGSTCRYLLLRTVR